MSETEPTTDPAPADAPNRMQEILDRAAEFSSLPDVLAQTLSITDNPEATVDQLVAVLERDPAIAAAILRQVNSAASGVRHEITSLSKAVNLLGFDQTRNLVVAATVCDLFKDDTPIGPYSRSRLWRHMVAVAITARLVARNRRACDPESAYLGGLLHDIGIAIEDQHDHERFKAMLEAYTAARPLPEMEQSALGYDHTQLGRALAEGWGMPDFVLHAIEKHHDRVIDDGPHASLLACVQLANTMVSMQGTPSAEVQIPAALTNVVEHLKLGHTELIAMIDEMIEEISQNPTMASLDEPIQEDAAETTQAAVSKDETQAPDAEK